MVKEKDDDEGEKTAATTSNSKKSYITKWTNLLCEVRKNEQTKSTVTITKIEESDQDSNGLQKRNKVDGSMLGSIVELGAKLGASSLLKWWVSAGTKSLSIGIGKRLIDEGIKQAPDLYRFGTSKIKNENVRKALESEVAN